ncbi:MAG TPA: hypothetical protein VLW50_06100 [Streptosporangiaceae bacterium]|nr:hypothetical protein [Streptosporangiaceae bacterium]
MALRKAGIDATIDEARDTGAASSAAGTTWLLGQQIRWDDPVTAQVRPPASAAGR